MPTDWTTALQNPKALRAVWDTPPPLDGSRMAELHIDADRVRLRFDPPVPPDRGNPRWPATANRVQVTLDLFFVEALRCDGVPVGRCETLSIERADERVRVQIASPSATLACTARYAQIAGMTGYVDGAVGAKNASE